MSTPANTQQQRATSCTTTVFTSGNSQAVRLPKEFRFDTKQVTIERRGDEVVLRAKKPTVADLLRGMSELSAQDRAEWDKAMTLIDKAPSQERDWDALFTDPATSK
ncbi:MAG: AbrB/MazE/SpoVT family DNA-binding domain-containing protein [Rhodoferax sp.]|nr:AbrB/MazE/SpoVT family DNA-binding domain-containing protein [Rhodoferax sp.]